MYKILLIEIHKFKHNYNYKVFFVWHIYKYYKN